MGLSCYLPVVGLAKANSNDLWVFGPNGYHTLNDLQRCSLVPRSL